MPGWVKSASSSIWGARVGIGLFSIWLVAVAVVGAAIYADQKWPEAAKRDGPPVLLVVALLALLALLLPVVRRALSRVTQLKVGGVEITLGALTESGADPIKSIAAGQEEDDQPDTSELHVIRSASSRFAETSLEQLSDQLGERLDWIWENLPNLGKRPANDDKAVDRLARDGLLPSPEAAVLRATATLELEDVQRARATDRQVLERFLRQADAVVHQTRLIAFDRHVRGLLRAENFTLVGWNPQPKGRWPDFLAHAHGRGGTDRLGPDYWISVRLAEDRDSKLFKKAVERLADKARRIEVPCGRSAKPLIVVPNGSCAPLKQVKGDVRAVRLRDLSDVIGRKDG
jgi:hypothetical protein